MKKCRCHGVSGSCSMKTCFMQVASFGEVSRRLREKYRKAERLSYETVEVSVTLGNSARELANEKVIPIKQNSLVYLVQSPDYCIPNPTEGIFLEILIFRYFIYLHEFCFRFSGDEGKKMF